MGQPIYCVSHTQAPFAVLSVHNLYVLLVGAVEPPVLIGRSPIDLVAADFVCMGGVRALPLKGHVELALGTHPRCTAVSA